MRGLRLGLGVARLALGASGGTPPPLGPTNLTLPSIDGSPVDGTSWTFYLGEWAGNVTGFEISVVTIETTPATLMAWQAVTGNTVGSVNGAAGKSIKLLVRASDGAASTIAESPAFGPVAPAGDTFILGLAFGTGQPETPYPWTGLSITTTDQAQYPQTNPNNAAIGAVLGGTPDLKYGWGGASASVITYQTSPGEPRRKARLASNLANTQDFLQIDLPSTGVYRVYMGFGSLAGTSNPNIGIWQGIIGVGSTSRHQMGPVACTASQVCDVMGNVTNLAAWQAVDAVQCGQFVEVTVDNTRALALCIARSTNASASTPTLNCVAVFRKA